MILFIFLQISSHFPASNTQLHSTFCICQNSHLVNCSKICGQYTKVDFKSRSISNCLKDYNQELINFLIAGTFPNSSKLMPKFDLNDFDNKSAIFYSIGNLISSSDNNTVESKYNKEHIIIYNGTAGKNTNILFTNINIHFRPGNYRFNNLHLFNTDFTPFQTDGVVTNLYQHYLASDYDSISRIPITVKHYGPTKGAEIECDANINNIVFFKNLNILLAGKNEHTRQCLLDLSQVGQKYNTTFILHSRDINISFDSLPTNEFDVPKIAFKMQSNTKIFINSDQFENEKMLINRITFIHKSKTLYLYSKNGTIPPVFSYDGSGYRYSNDKKRTFYNNYCICPKLDCEEKCGRNVKIINNLDSLSLDETVVGNPSESLTYFIANSKEAEGKYPIFNLEHFGDRKLKVIGSTSDEHVGFIGDATDDIGEFSFSKLTMHTKSGQNSLLFPNVSFHSVKIYQLNLAERMRAIEEGKKKDSAENENQKENGSKSSVENDINEEDKRRNEGSINDINKLEFKFEFGSLDSLFRKSYFLKCTYLIIDYSTLKNFVNSSVSITAPQKGFEIHSSGDISLRFFTSNHVEFDKLYNVSLMPHTTLTIHASGNIKFFISRHFPRTVTSFPKLRIMLEGDQNTVEFPGDSGWPKELEDISAKVTLVHGDETVYVNGQIDSENKNFTTKPPIVDHKGNGPFFINGLLSNFKDAYCICDGQRCAEKCAKSVKDEDEDEDDERKNGSLWPPIKFSEESIAKTAIGNPTKQINYFIHGSSPSNRPLFGLHTFQSKSFSIIGCNDEQFTTADRTNKNNENDDDEEKNALNPSIATKNTTATTTAPSSSLYKDESDGVFQFVALEGTHEMSEIVSSSVSHIFSNVDILLTNAGIYFFNNVVFTNCRIRLNESVSLVPRNGMNRFFKIIQSGMTIDMPTLHSFLSSKMKTDISVPSTSYLTVNGGSDMSKIIIDDMYHLILLDKEGKLDSRIDVSLLKRNPPKLKTLKGQNANEPLLIEWKKNNEIQQLNDMPHFTIDVSDFDYDDAYISFVGRKWYGEFKNLSSRVTIKHDKINVHLISEKVEIKKTKKFKKIRPPIVNLEGTGDLYIDGKKQLSRSAFINGNIMLANNDDYYNDHDFEYREKISYFIYISITIIVGFIVCFALFAVLKHQNFENYGKMRNTAFLTNRKFDDQLNILPIEPFQTVEEQSE